MGGRRGFPYLELTPASGLRMLKAPLHQALPVFQPKIQMARMDQIELLLVAPRLLDVVHLELAVRRHPAWLDRRQVIPDHERAGVHLGHLDRPEARAGAEVEDRLRVGG